MLAIFKEMLFDVYVRNDKLHLLQLNVLCRLHFKQHKLFYNIPDFSNKFNSGPGKRNKFEVACHFPVTALHSAHVSRR